MLEATLAARPGPAIDRGTARLAARAHRGVVSVVREDVAVGWEALDQWGDDVARVEPLTGGVGVNELWSVRVNGQRAVGRLGRAATPTSRGRPSCCDTSTAQG